MGFIFASWSMGISRAIENGYVHKDLSMTNPEMVV